MEDRNTSARLSAASLLLIAAVHGAASHRFDKLQILCDIRQCARQAAGPIDIDWLKSAADKTGSRLAVSTGLHLAGQVFQDSNCVELGRVFHAGISGRLARLLLPPSTLLRPGGLRRQLFRELLKRS